MKGVKADVVFLAIGTLGKQSEQFAKDYWREVVQTTGARLVIPTHWDNFGLPLSQPLQKMPPPGDDVDKSMGWLSAFGAADKVTVRFPKEFQPIDLPAPRR